MKKQEVTIEEKIYTLLDTGYSLDEAFRVVDADKETRELFSALRTLADTTIPVPSRNVFYSIIEKTKHPIPTLSPYAPIQSIFSLVRSSTPFLLGVLILLSGIGIQAGVIGHSPVREDVFSTIPTTSKSTQSSSSKQVTPSESPERTVALEDAQVAVENYDAYFTDESDSLMSLASAYDVSF